MTQEPPKAASRRILPALIAWMTALPALAIDMSLPALPETAGGLGVGTASAQLTIGVFLVGFALAQLACGPLSDRLGRRPVLLAGLALFAVAGGGCAAAPTLPVLLGCRFLQGVGACAGPVLARAIIRDLFTGDVAAAKLAQATAIMALAPMVAPSIGALILATLGWRSIFVTLGLSGLALLLVVTFRLDETLVAKDRGALAPQALLRNAKSFLGCRQALANALAAAFLFGGMFAYIAASPFAFMAVLGVSPNAYSAILALSAFGIVTGSLAGPRLVRSLGRTPAVLGGLALGTAAGSLLLALALSDRVEALTLLVAAGLYMFSRGLVLPFATAAAMEPMGQVAGLASGIMGALQMAMAAIVTLAVSWVADPFVGMGVALALSGAAALACGLWAQGGGVAQRRERLA